MLLPYADSLRRLDMLRKSWEMFIGVGPPSMPSLSTLEEKVKANVIQNAQEVFNGASV